MKLWIDDVRPAPRGYEWAKTVNEAMYIIMLVEQRHKNNYLDMSNCWMIESIDIDHDAGDYVSEGGDYIKLLDWFEITGRNYPIHIHSTNPVGVANMRAIIKRNGWVEV